jgi:hypothetical protein
MTGHEARVSFEYFVVRYVPRVDRGEFVNVGVVLYSSELGFLDAAYDASSARLRGFAPDVDLDAVRAALDTIVAICRADARVGPIALESARNRFGWLSAPRSTVVQPGPVHGGVTDDPGRQLVHLLDCLVR